MAVLFGMTEFGVAAILYLLSLLVPLGQGKTMCHSSAAGNTLTSNLGTGRKGRPQHRSHKEFRLTMLDHVAVLTLGESQQKQMYRVVGYRQENSQNRLCPCFFQTSND